MTSHPIQHRSFSWCCLRCERGTCMTCASSRSKGTTGESPVRSHTKEKQAQVKARTCVHPSWNVLCVINVRARSQGYVRIAHQLIEYWYCHIRECCIYSCSCSSFYSFTSSDAQLSGNEAGNEQQITISKSFCYRRFSAKFHTYGGARNPESHTQ